MNDYTISNASSIDSPALIVFPREIDYNIDLALKIAKGPERFRPHVKTHKMVELTRMMISKGINKFKCATIPEAEMLAIAGANDVLLAYQPSEVKAHRLRELALAYPLVNFGYLIDNKETAAMAAETLTLSNTRCWIDVNVGMDRTGLPPAQIPKLFEHCKALNNQPVGLHAYDGHIHDTHTGERFSKAEKIYSLLMGVMQKLVSDVPLQLVMGGTPGFPFYADKPEVQTSPGTFVFWDAGYEKNFPDMPFKIAAVLLVRVISVLNETTICLDLGHKSVAAEGPLPRVYFPSYPQAAVIAQNEEHLVVKLVSTENIHCGDVWYGIPQHICPTVALYDLVYVAENNQVMKTWKVVARDRKISF